MVTTISWSTDADDIIDRIRNTIGRTITIYTTVSGIPCPVSGCGLDPITNLSTDPFCIVCSGEYWINTLSGYPITAHVSPGMVDLPVWTPGGYIVEGDLSVQIKYTLTNVDAVESAAFYEVDNKNYIQKDVSYRGVPNINRIIIRLEETEG